MNDNGTNKTVINCPHCSQRFSVTAPTPEEPLNTLRMSIAAASHEKPVKCPNNKCAKSLVWVIKEATFSWTLIKITDEQAASLSERPNLIVAPPPNLMIH
jgi:hypothetical protein